MGYTNYWDQPTNFTDQEWNVVREEFEYIREIAKDKIDVEDVHDCIAFNGGTGGGCETFILLKEVPTEKLFEEENIGEFFLDQETGEFFEIIRLEDGTIGKVRRE